MAGLSQKQTDELMSIGLDVHQVKACEEILIQIPSDTDLASIKRLSKALQQAQSGFDDIRNSDPNFYDEIERQLQSKVAWSRSLLSTIAETLEGVHAQQQGVYVSEVDFDSNEQVTRVTTPKSRDFRRYQALTDLWRSWGKLVKTTKDSEFLSFLTICLKGRFSFDGVASVRTHYLRYFWGKTKEVSTGDTEHKSDLLEVEITLKNGQKQVARMRVPKMDALDKDIRQLKKSRS